MSKQSVNLLEGDIKSGLLRFALPLFLGQVFQQMYNMVDALVVGNLCGENALAAVTSTGSLIFLIVGFFGGVYGGVGVVIARCFGAGDEYQVKRAVGTAVLGTVLSGLFLTLLGYFGSPVLLGWMGTPPEVMEDAVAYLGIYFLGILFVVLYNSAVGIFQAIGDSKRPLYYLIISSVTNVVLDILFVGPMNMGVRGAALATVIAQGLSAGLAFFRLSRAQGAWRVSIKGLCLDKPLLKEMLRIGLPAGFQGMVFSLSNVLIQSSVNSFGSLVMAGNTAAANIEGFVYTAMNSFYQTNLSFTSQNYGAKNKERLGKVLICCLGIVTVVGAVIGNFVYLFGEFFLGFYTTDPQVIQYGMNRLAIISTMYFICGWMDVMVGSIRGMGYAIMPMIVSLLGACAFRVVWVLAIFPMFRTQFNLYISYPISWSITFAAHLVCYLVVRKKVYAKLDGEKAI